MDRVKWCSKFHFQWPGFSRWRWTGGSALLYHISKYYWKGVIPRSCNHELVASHDQTRGSSLLGTRFNLGGYSKWFDSKRQPFMLNVVRDLHSGNIHSHTFFGICAENEFQNEIVLRTKTILLRKRPNPVEMTCESIHVIPWSKQAKGLQQKQPNPVEMTCDSTRHPVINTG